MHTYKFSQFFKFCRLCLIYFSIVHFNINVLFCIPDLAINTRSYIYSLVIARYVKSLHLNGGICVDGMYLVLTHESYFYLADFNKSLVFHPFKVG